MRDIGAFSPWMEDKVNCYKGNNVDDFVELIQGVVEKQLPDVSEAGRKTAEERSIENIGKQLKAAYEDVLSEVK